MYKIIALSFCFLLAGKITAQHKTKKALKSGQWTGSLQLNDSVSLPFEVFLKQENKGQPEITIFNGEERIVLKNKLTRKDSIIVTFPVFDSELHLTINSKKVLKGYWLNLNKKGNYTIPCTLTYGYSSRFKHIPNNLTVNHFPERWKSVFEPGEEGEYPAVGLFKTKGNELNGTFLTETGDYRFLAGNLTTDSLYVSCFDGSHAFLFTAQRTKDHLDGQFYSGKHWHSRWIADADPNFELRNPDSITFLVNKEAFHFELNDLNGDNFSFPNKQFENKVTVIQIMGTWCPNCMDETRYLKTLYKEYHPKGLEIISIGYEVGDTQQEHIQKIKTLQDRLDLNFTFLVGGSANKNLASTHFSMLNQIVSFPTMILLDRMGNVRLIHTGFNGPGTGDYYKEFDLNFKKLLDELISE